MLSYIVSTLGVDANVGLTASMLGAAANIAVIPVYGALSDRIGRPKTFLLGAAAIIVTAAPIFLLVGTGSPWAIIFGVVLFLGLGHGLVYAPLPAMYCELFPTSVRYSGISVGYQMASILLASFTPALASAMVLWTGGSLWPVIGFAIGTTIVAAIAISFAPDNRHIPLNEIGIVPAALDKDAQPA